MFLFLDLIMYGKLPITSPFQGFIYIFSNIVALLFAILYFHQVIYVIVGTIKTAKVKDKVFKLHTLGVVISARNESGIIANLIKSVRACDYPQAMVNIFVVADNCTDNTAQLCRDMGCIVFERNDLEHIGKGYALNFMFNKLHNEPEYADKVPEAYIILDADNVVTSSYLTEMNKVYDSGYEMVTSYRNSKNFGDNWISSGYGYWFLHEARHINNARMMFKSSCTILGTGFLISQKMVKEYDNWNFHTLTEDFECSTETVLRRNKMGYAHNAEFYDEQPTGFKQSWVQRQRWVKGFLQVFKKRGAKLMGHSFINFACYDVMTTILPALVLTTLNIVVLGGCSIVALCMANWAMAWYAVLQLLISWGWLFLMMIIIATTICITEWKKIRCPGWKKILYIFTFPFFMFTYIWITLSTFINYKKIGWTQIKHTVNVTIDDIEKKN